MQPTSTVIERTPVAATRSSGRPWLTRYGQDLVLLGVLAVLVIFFSVASKYFLYPANLTNLLLAVSVVGTMAAVGTLVLVTGNLDLSVGSNAAFSGVLTIWLIEFGGWPTLAAIVAGLVAGTAVGAFNGAFGVFLKINPIITTIGMLSVLRGMAFVLTGGSEILIHDEFVLSLGSARWLGVPVAVWAMLATFAVVAIVANWTVVGRNLFAVGANSRASLLSGVPVGRYNVVIFAVSGLSAALAGLLLVGQAGTAASGAATGYELQVITAVLLGGTAIQGGIGRVRGTLLAVLIIGTLNNGMTLLAVPSYFQTVASGLLLLLAVGIAQARQLSRRRGVD